MPKFVIPWYDGRTVTVNAPKGATYEEAVAKVEQDFEQQQARENAVSGALGQPAQNPVAAASMLAGLQNMARGKDYASAAAQEGQAIEQALSTMGPMHPVWQTASQLGGGIVTSDALLAAMQWLQQSNKQLEATRMVTGPEYRKRITDRATSITSGGKQ